MNRNPSPEDLARIVTELQTRMTGLEGRVRELEVLAGPGALPVTAVPAQTEAVGMVAETPPFPTPAPATEESTFGRFLSLSGRSIMVLALAFLLRFLTDSHILPPVPGVMMGVSLGLLLIFLADRAGLSGNRPSANAHGLTAAIIAFPLIFETVATLHIIAVPVGAGMLTLVSGGGLVAAWRQHLRKLAWAFSLGSLVLVLALVRATNEIFIFGYFLIALGVGTCILAYTRHWHLIRWAVAAVLAMLLVRLVFVSITGEVQPPANTSFAAIRLLCLLYLFAYLGTFAWRAAIKGRGVKVFDIVQSLLVVTVGFGGAMLVSHKAGHDSVPLGWLALSCALAWYTMAFLFVSTRHGRGRAFFYFATLGLVFLFLASLLIAQGSWLTWSWIILGLASAMISVRFGRITLRYHSAVYLMLATVHSGLMKAALAAFIYPPDKPWVVLPPLGIVAFFSLIIGYIILLSGPEQRSESFQRQIPRLILAALFLEGIGYAAVRSLLLLLTNLPPHADPSLTALVRTLVIALTCVTLALVRRRWGMKEWGWLVYPLLFFGGFKLALEDLRTGSPLTLALGFAVFGAALILSPRLLRSHSGTDAQT